MFRPCIDLHDGRVKQIVGSSINDSQPSSLHTNFISEKPPAWFAKKYRQDNLHGGHVIKLGKGNNEAALEALSTWPGGLQIGGGINAKNASSWINAGSSQVIITSWLFQEGKIETDRLKHLQKKIGKSRLVIDLSCRRRGDDYFVVEGTANFDVKHMNYDADKREINFKIQSSLDYNLVEIIIPNNLLKGDDLTFMITSIPTAITQTTESSSITSPLIPKIIHHDSTNVFVTLEFNGIGTH